MPALDHQPSHPPHAQDQPTTQTHPNWIRDQDGIIRSSLQRYGASPSKWCAVRVGQLDDSAIQTHARPGSLIRLARGAYLTIAEWLTLTPEQRLKAQAKALVPRGSKMVLTREAAAVMHGFPLADANVPIALAHCSRRPGKPIRTQFGRYVPQHNLIRVSGKIRPEDIVEVDGRLVTDVPKTVVDTCRTHARNGIVVADHALLGYLSDEELWATFDAYPRSPGNSPARELLALATPYSQSVAESLTKMVVVDSGVLRIGGKRYRLLQQIIFFDLNGRFIARVDLFIPELGLIIEFDGRGKYFIGSDEEREARVVSELEREKALKNLGLTILRFNWRELHDGTAVKTLQKTAADIRDCINAGIGVYDGDFRQGKLDPIWSPRIKKCRQHRREAWAKAGRLY